MVAQKACNFPEFRLLIDYILARLPDRFSGHFSMYSDDPFRYAYDLVPAHSYNSMYLPRHRWISDLDVTGLFVFQPRDAQEIVDFYHHHNPNATFHPALLETGQWPGIREHGTLLAVGGVHVYSQSRRVAVLGGVEVKSDGRRRGYGEDMTRALCIKLQRTANYIGLMVDTHNRPAMNLYDKLGFTHRTVAETCIATRRI